MHHPKVERAKALLRGAGLHEGMSDTTLATLQQERLTPLGEDLRIIRAERNLLMFVNVMAPGAIGPPLHSHLGADQVEYVLRGRLAATVGEQQMLLETGDAVYIPRGCPHTFSPVGDGAVVASVVEGRWHPLQFFRSWEGTPAHGALDAHQRDQLSCDLWTLARTRVAESAGTAVQ